MTQVQTMVSLDKVQVHREAIFDEINRVIEEYRCGTYNMGEFFFQLDSMRRELSDVYAEEIAIYRDQIRSLKDAKRTLGR